MNQWSEGDAVFGAQGLAEECARPFRWNEKPRRTAKVGDVGYSVGNGGSAVEEHVASHGEVNVAPLLAGGFMAVCSTAVAGAPAAHNVLCDCCKGDVIAFGSGVHGEVYDLLLCCAGIFFCKTSCCCAKAFGEIFVTKLNQGFTFHNKDFRWN